MRSLMVVSAACLATMAGAVSATAGQTVAPMHPIMQEVGARAVMAFYVPEAGACAVTVMIDESAATSEQPGMPFIPAARVRLVLPPLASTAVDGGNGDSLRLTCGREAGGLSAEMTRGEQRLAAR